MSKLDQIAHKLGRKIADHKINTYIKKEENRLGRKLTKDERDTIELNATMRVLRNSIGIK